MSRKSGLDIQKGIIALLAERERSLRELETKLNTNYNSVRAHCKMLAFYGIVEFHMHEEHEMNKRPYTTVSLTDRGRSVLEERKNAVREA